MPHLALAPAMLIGAGISGVASAIGSHSAAKAQTNAANSANALQQAMYNQTRTDLLPFQQFGQQGMADYNQQKDWLNSPFSMTQANLEQTPGYQFTLNQGLKSVNNQMGARGLLNSGAAMRGAADYATGLADSTYMNQFNMDQTQKQNISNRLMGAIQTGGNAAAQTGNYGTQTAAGQAQNTIGAGNANAGASMATANAFGQIGQVPFQNALLTQMMARNGGMSGMYGRPTQSWTAGPGFGPT